MTCIEHVNKKHDILSQNVKKVRKLFHRTNRLIAVVKSLHFSGAGTIFMHVQFTKAKTKERGIFFIWRLVPKRYRTHFSKCHMIEISREKLHLQVQKRRPQ